MDRPVKFNKKISPICLPSGGARHYSGFLATVVGWGSLRESENFEMQIKISFFI